MTPNCPFYGYSIAFNYSALSSPSARPEFAPITLVHTHGNQCALITGAHSPCQMEAIGSVDWQVCPLVQGRLIAGKSQ